MPENNFHPRLFTRFILLGCSIVEATLLSIIFQRSDYTNLFIGTGGIFFIKILIYGSVCLYFLDFAISIAKPEDKFLLELLDGFHTAKVVAGVALLSTLTTDWGTTDKFVFPLQIVIQSQCALIYIEAACSDIKPFNSTFKTVNENFDVFFVSPIVRLIQNFLWCVARLLICNVEGAEYEGVVDWCLYRVFCCFKEAFLPRVHTGVMMASSFK